MNEEGFIELIKSYEASNAVEDYVINGWHVWPLLKMIPCMGYLPQTLPTMPPTARHSLIHAALRRILTLYKSFKRSPPRPPLDSSGEFDTEHNDAHDARRDAVVLTLSERRVLQNGALYEIYSDPLVELLNDQGVSTLVWEQGEERYPRHSKSAWISSRLRAEYRLIKQPVELPEEPIWFMEYQIFASKIMGRTILWREVAALIDRVSNQSEIFERWLRKTGASYLFVVCWYNPVTIAAVLAAKRCGIKTIEIQHGLLSNMMYHYSMWLRAPKGGFEAIPDVFWLWGKSSLEDIRQSSPALAKTCTLLAGGNLWLNMWLNRLGKIRSLNEGADTPIKKILVTLQLDISPVLLEAIQHSPHTWKWLIRFHPAREKGKRTLEEEMLRSIGHPDIEIERASEALLYELLCECDVHVTEYSACAIEALAFGVPSVIIGVYGRENFIKYIQQGLMFYVESGEQLNSEITRSRRIAPKNISDLFASNDDAHEALRIIIA